jgi:hypothetical protein
VKSSNASGTGKAELHDLPQATLQQLLVLKCLSMLRPLFARINTSQQLALSKGRVTSSELDIQRSLQDGFLRASQLNTELREWLKERPSYPTPLKQMKPRPSILNWRKKRQSMEWHHPHSLQN